MNSQQELQDARRNDAAILALISTIQGDVAEMKQTLDNHIATEPNEWAKVVTDLMKKAFPDGDPEGHRRFHELSIRAETSRAEFWSKMTYEIKKWGLIGFTLWAAKTLVEAAALWLQSGGHIK